ELDAAVLRASIRRLAFVERPGVSVTHGLQSIGLHALLDEEVSHRLGARLRQLHVLLGAAHVVGVAFDADPLHLRVGLHLLGDAVHQRLGAAGDAVRAGVEVDVLGQLDLAAGDGHLAARVGAAVAVVVDLGAAVVVLEAVLVLGLVGAFVELVGDAVLIVVEIGAAVLVVEAVAILGLRRAQIAGVGDAVAVGVEAAGGDRALAFGRRPAHAAEDAEVIVTQRRGEDAGAGADADRDVLDGEELKAADDVGGVILAGVERAVLLLRQRHVAEHFGGHADPVHEAVGDAGRPGQLVADVDEHALGGGHAADAR